MDHESADDHRADWCSRYSNDVTTPKLPPPPRIAQNRSVFSSALACTSSPFASTRSAPSEVVHGHPESALEPPEAAAERQTGDSGIAYSSAGGREAKRLRLTIELCPAQAGFGAHGLRPADPPGCPSCPRSRSPGRRCTSPCRRCHAHRHERLSAGHCHARNSPPPSRPRRCGIWR